MAQAEVEGDQSSEGGASEGGARGTGERAELAVDEGLEFFGEEAAVEGAKAPFVAAVGNRGVLGDAVDAGVTDADEDEGLDAAGGNQGVGGEVSAPGFAGEGGARIEEVLAVVEVEDGKAAVGLAEVSDGQVDADVPVGGEKARAEARDAPEARVEVELSWGL